MFKAIKEFFIGKPVEAPKVEDKVEAVNAAPYKVEAVPAPADIAVQAVVESIAPAKKKPAPKKAPAAKKAPAVKKPRAPKASK